MAAKSLNRISQGGIDKVIIFVFPILITLFNSNWIFSPILAYLPDPWFYLGYFRYFFDYVSKYPSNIHYFVERITWNIPGYFIYHILPPLLANYVLHLLVCYIALFSLYGILNSLFGNRTALLSTLLLSAYPWFLRAVGWDYVDGVGIAQMLLMIYLLGRGQNSKNWKGIAVLAGCVHASLLITNLFWVGFAPGWIVYYLLINSPLSKDKFIRLLGEAVYFIIGNLILTFCCALFYYSMTGNYFFLFHNVAFSLGKLKNNDDLRNFILSFYSTTPATWHLLPALLSFSAIWQLISKRIKPAIPLNPLLAKVFLFFTISYGWLIFWHFISLPYLVIFLYCSFTIPATFLLLGAIIAEPLNKLDYNQFNQILTIAALTLLLPFYLVTQFPSLENIQGNISLIVAAGIIILFCMARPLRTTTTLVIMLGILSFLSGGNARVFNSNPNNGKEHFLAIIKASDIVDSSFPNRIYSTFRFWYRMDDNYPIFFSLSSLYLYPWGSSLNNINSDKAPSPVLALYEGDQFHDEDNIVILSSNPDASQVLLEANNAFAKRNAKLELDHRYKIKEGSVVFELYFTKVKLIP